MASRVRSTISAPPPRVTARVEARANRASQPWNWGWLLLGAIVLTLVAFEPSLDGIFVFDDYHLPFADPHAAEMPAHFWIGGVRPVLIATYWANFLLSGTQPFLYHVVNLLLHAGTGVLVFFILERLLALADVASSRRWLALFGAALFLLHPLQTESVDYIAGRSELVSSILFFAAWLMFLRSFEEETRFETALWVMFLAGASVLSKESTISLPAVLIATDFFWKKESFAAQLRRRLKLYVPFVIGGLLGAVLILRTLTTGGAGSAAGVKPIPYALTQCRVILVYIRLFFIPVGQNGDWQMPFFQSLTTGGAWFYVLALLALVGATVWLYRRSRLASFGLLVFLLMLAPTSSFVPIKDALAERRMYAPMIGLILVVLDAAIVFVARAWVSAANLRIAAIAALAICAGLSWRRSEVWVNDVDFWRDAANKNPSNARAYFGLGAALMKQQNCAQAIPPLLEARARKPADMQIAFDLVSAYQCTKQPARAVPVLRRILASQPSPDAYNLLGYLEATQGHLPEAMAALEGALRLDPNNVTAFAYRGLAKMAARDTEGAEADFNHALELDPGNGTATNGLDALAKMTSGPPGPHQ